MGNLGRGAVPKYEGCPNGARVKKQKPDASLLMWTHLKELRPEVVQVQEFKFAPPRKWRFDFAIYVLRHTSMRFAIEIEGGAWISGRHNRGTGFINDMEKYNNAALLGWRVLRFTPQQVLDGTAIAFIKKVLEG